MEVADQGDVYCIPPGDSDATRQGGRRPKRPSGAVRRARARQNKAVVVAYEVQCEEDKRDIHELLEALARNPFPVGRVGPCDGSNRQRNHCEEGAVLNIGQVGGESDEQVGWEEQAKLLASAMDQEQAGVVVDETVVVMRLHDEHTHDGNQDHDEREEDREGIASDFKGRASDCATESTCGDMRAIEDDVDNDPGEPEAIEGRSGQESDVPEEAMILWPATPESTPPSSPRFFHSQPQPMVWVPVPVWIPAIQ